MQIQATGPLWALGGTALPAGLGNCAMANKNRNETSKTTFTSVISQADAWLSVVPWRGTGDQTRADDAAQVMSETSGLPWQWAPTSCAGRGCARRTRGSLRFSSTGQSGPARRSKLQRVKTGQKHYLYSYCLFSLRFSCSTPRGFWENTS